MKNRKTVSDKKRAAISRNPRDGPPFIKTPPARCDANQDGGFPPEVQGAHDRRVRTFQFFDRRADGEGFSRYEGSSPRSNNEFDSTIREGGTEKN